MELKKKKSQAHGNEGRRKGYQRLGCGEKGEMNKIKKAKLHGRCQGPGGGSHGGLLFNGYRASGLQDEQRFGAGGGDGCTAAWL